MTTALKVGDTFKIPDPVQIVDAFTIKRVKYNNGIVVFHLQLAEGYPTSMPITVTPEILREWANWAEAAGNDEIRKIPVIYHAVPVAQVV